MKNDTIKKLLDTAAESPKKAAHTIDSLIGKLGSAMSGTVNFEVPKKFEKIFTKFNDAEDISDTEVKSITKGFNISKLSTYFDTDDMVPVSLDLSKIKNIFKKGSKAVEESDNIDSMKEDVSLFEDAGATALIMSIAMANIFSLAVVCYALYVGFLAHKHNVVNLFSDGRNSSTTLEAIGNMAIATLLPPIYLILLHIKIHKMKKNGELNESLDADSILDTLYESTEDLSDNESDHDSELIEAYRKVVEDLTRRVPDDNNAMI